MKRIFSLMAMFLLLQSSVAMAASGLVSFNRIDVQFKYNRTEENVTCVQDAKDEKQWYYVSNKPRLAESKKGEPIMMLVSYQKNTKAGIKNDGGILQCGINLSLPEGALPELKKALAKNLGVSESKVKLAPLDMRNAKVMVYSPGGELMATDLKYPEIGPSFANECIPIQMNLTGLGVSVVDSLVKGTGGLGLYFSFDYDALTPECSVTIEANYRQAFSHFSTDSKTKADAGRWWLFKASADVNYQKVRESLENSKAITIKSIAGEKFTDEQINKITEPIVEKIMAEIFNVEAPAKIDPAKASEPRSAGYAWFSASTSLSMKDIKQVKEGTYKYDMRKQWIETRKTTVGGIIGLNGYSQSQREACVVTVDPTYWKRAFYSLPTISKSLSGIDQMTVSVNFLYDGKQAEGTEQQLAIWTKKDGWVDPQGEECIGLAFPLKYFYDKYSKTNKFADKLSYQQNFVVTYMEGNNTKFMKFTTKVPAFTGEIPISTPMVGATYVEFNAESTDDDGGITWDRGSYEGGEFDGLKSNLTKIGVKMTSKDPKNNQSLTLTKNKPVAGFWIDNKYNEKTGVYTVPTVEATYTFYNTKLAKSMETKDKKSIVLENKDALGEGPSIIFMDDDYMPVDKPDSYK